MIRLHIIVYIFDETKTIRQKPHSDPTPVPGPEFIITRMSRESGSSGSGVQGLGAVLGLLRLSCSRAALGPARRFSALCFPLSVLWFHRSRPEEGKHSVANGENQGIPVGSAVNHAATDPGRASRPSVEPPKERSLSGSVPDPNSRGSSRAPSHPNTEVSLSRHQLIGEQCALPHETS